MLISVEDVKDFLGIDVTDHDNKLLPLCQSAQNEADRYCNRTLEGSTFVEIMDGNGIDIIHLRNTPIKSISSIYDDYDRAYGADTLISSNDYAFDALQGIVRAIGFVFANEINNIKVTYLGGYNGIGETAYTALPYDLKQALIFLTSAMYLEGQAGVNVMEGQEMVYRPNHLRKQAFAILDRYRWVLL